MHDHRPDDPDKGQTPTPASPEREPEAPDRHAPAAAVPLPDAGLASVAGEEDPGAAMDAPDAADPPEAG